MKLFRKSGGRQSPPDSVFVLAAADFHCGSAYGKMPENFLSSTGNIVKLNSGQQYLRDIQEDILARLPQIIDLLLLDGDMTDGPNKAEAGRGLSEVDPDYQVDAAIQSVAPFVERTRVRPTIPQDKLSSSVTPRYIISTQGSGYHNGGGGGSDAQLGKAIGAIPDSFGCYAWPWYTGWIGNVYIDLAHHQAYMTNSAVKPLEREIGHCRERLSRERQPTPGHILIIRAHTHKGLKVVEEDGATGISVPAMKIQDDYAKGGKTPNRTLPSDLGMVGIKVYKERVNGKYLEIIPYTYPHPTEQPRQIFDGT